MSKIKDLVGQRFGRLIVISFAGIKKEHAVWNVECNPNYGGCGTKLQVAGNSLQSGNTSSCGCLHRDVNRARFLGETNPNWRGGKCLTEDGYIRLAKSTAEKLYPEAVLEHNRTVEEHRVAMSHYLRRALYPNETVHHKDGNRTNNNLDNLELRDGHHGPGQRVDDIMIWAVEFLKRYAPHLLKD